MTGLDPAKRAYTLKRKDGKESTFTAPPEMVNYDQLRVRRRDGDALRADGDLPAPHGHPGRSGEEAASSRSLPRARSRAPAVQTTEFTATVWTVNVARHEVKLRMGDGGVKTFKVRTGVNLNKVVPGDVVVATMTESVTIKVEGH